MKNETHPSGDGLTCREPFATVVIPAYNEAARIGPTLAGWLDFARSCPHEIAILVVNDGSLDSTSDVVRRVAARNPCVQFLELPWHRGKGAALRAGMAAVSGRYICYTDADLPTDPAIFLDFVALLASRHAAVAIAVRSADCPTIDTPFFRELASAFYRGLVNKLVLPEIRDSQCGFKVLDRPMVAPLLAALRIDGFAFDVELLRAVLDARLQVAEVPTRMIHRPGSTVRLWRDSFTMTRDLLRIAAGSRVRRLSAWKATWANVG